MTDSKIPVTEDELHAYIDNELPPERRGDVEAWLAAHPTRRSNSEARTRSREFKVAMRQRIREVAASRNLSDEEIRPVLKLKHETIGRFCQAHDVNIGWLLEGIGPVFKIWPAQ